MPRKMDLIERDRTVIWHPFTQEKLTPPPMAIKRAEGTYLFDADGNAYLDLISSWWVNIHGHTQPQIAEAIREQCQTLEHVIFARFTHEPAVRLCENLRDLLPVQLSKFFFSDNGSTCVEVALKMAYQFWKNKSEDKKHFLAFEGAYHGDTVGSMSVGMESHFHDTFRELCFTAKFVPYPETWPGDARVEDKEKSALSAMRKHIEECDGGIVALIVEPLIQCAGGMRMCRPGFIRNAVQLARQNDIFVIFDEVAVGFGRTGTNFALEQIDAVPDFLCLSKGITGGFLPLAVTVTTKQVYDGFLGDTIDKAFLHGHSYTANPVGCAAAIASLKLLVEEKTKQAIRDINEIHIEETTTLMRVFDGVAQHARVLGTIAALELELENMAGFVENCLRNNIIIRPLGKTVYLMPPYCISREDLRRAYQVITAALHASVIIEEK